ncbi:mitochondrial inner membrane protein OXA1L-like isoform X2 [Mya arenaria]|uniref:mitochondrial inner membrane protein OXA1L-like isoform X2 n=1 Tax=Mya arenaria TaxID=6604 RepID=UPI0022E56EE9|nr:mitochondrial inner membrane protein OXA1L-like isoform X2 [Mya arenaria]XP_052817384.1 mitochondrial inner membrane protein OXA1L-like isoform X2 [Mya arenaria]
MATSMRNVIFCHKSLPRSIQNSFSRRLHTIHANRELQHRIQRHLKAGRFQALCVLTARHASTKTEIPEGYIPDIPAPPKLELIDNLPDLTALGEPTLQSLGLASWYPPGRMQALLEFFHVSIDMPWYACITLTAVALRLILLPIYVRQRKFAINMGNHSQTVQRLQRQVEDAKTTGNAILADTRRKSLQEYTIRNNLQPWKMFQFPAMQVPIMVSMFIGLRKMCDLPVMTLKSGGCLWFTDMTIADPYILPAITAVTILATIEFGSESTKASQMTHTMKWVLRSFPVIAFFFTSQYASAIAFYWTINNVLSLVVALSFRTDFVKKLAKMPDQIVPEAQKEQKPFIQGFKEGRLPQSTSVRSVKRKG